MTKYSYRDIELFTYWFSDVIKRTELENQTTLYTLHHKYIVETTDGLRYNMLNNHVCPILPDKHIHIYIPIDKNEYICPELLENNKLPFKVHYKSVYYSLGCLLEFLLEGHDYMGTKLYYFIKRCKNHNPLDRCMVL